MARTPAQVAFLGGDAPRVLLFLRIAGGGLPSPLRMWSGAGEFDLPIDAVETTGGVYLGIGRLIDVPSFGLLLNGKMERITLSLSGVDGVALGLADEDAHTVKGAVANVAVVALGDDLQPATPAIWVRDGTVDQMPISLGRTNSIGLSLGSLSTDRRRPPLGYYTPVDQRARSSTDAFCDLVPTYTADSTVRWPT